MPIFGHVQCWLCAHCAEALSPCVVSSCSKKAERGLCPDAARRPPGLLRGSGALPPAPHLDGQSDCGVRQLHVSVGETETAVSKHTHKRKLLHRGQSLNLCSSLSPPTPLSQH